MKIRNISHESCDYARTVGSNNINMEEHLEKKQTNPRENANPLSILFFWLVKFPFFFFNNRETNCHFQQVVEDFDVERGTKGFASIGYLQSPQSRPIGCGLPSFRKVTEFR